METAAKSKYQLVMFDFDGTLADSLPVFLQVFDQLADRFRFRRLDRSAIEAMRGRGARQLMRDHQVALWKLPFIARHGRTLMGRHIEQVRLFPAMAEALTQLQQAGIMLAVVTSNSRENVLAVLGPELAARFAHLECGISVFGKARRLRRLVQQVGGDPARVLFVGDELRDAEAAQKARVPFGAVAWGYTRADALAGVAPHERFAEVTDLLRLSRA